MAEMNTDAVDLRELNLNGLRSQCKKRGLAVSGTTTILYARIRDYDEAAKKSRGAQPPEPRTDPLPVQTRYNAPRPADDGSAISGVMRPGPVESGRTEEEIRLRQVCRDNHLPPRVRDEANQQHDAAHKDFIAERAKAYSSRDASIKRADTKCAKTIETLTKDRDIKLAESKTHIEKQKIWGTAFYKLNNLMIATGKPKIHPSEFDPTRYPPAAIPHSTPRPAALPTPPLTAASPGGRSTATMRSIATDTTSRKRSADEMDDEEQFDVVKRFSIRGELHDPFIFISDRTLQVRASDMREMREMIKRREVRLRHVRADPDGYYWVFGDYHEARICFDYFQGYHFHGVTLDLTLEDRSTERGRQVSSRIERR